MSFLFSTKEIIRRRERAQQLMRKDGFDALLLTNVENLIYFVGMPVSWGMHNSNDRPGIAILPLEGEPVCVASSIQAPVFKPVISDVNIKEYTSIRGVPNDVLVGAFKEAGLTHGRVGIEEGLGQRIGMPYGDYASLLRSLPEVRFVDASSLIWKMRMIKSEEEIRHMKRAAELTGIGRQRCFDNVVAGMTYREISRLLTRFMVEAGADGVSFAIVYSCPQDNMDFPQPRHMNVFPETRVRKLDALNIDTGACTRFYTTDFNRWATIGKASSKLVKYHKIVRKVSGKMAEAIKPGSTCSDIFKAGWKELKHHNVCPTQLGAGRMGHSIGMLFTEPPSVSAEDHTLLEPGLVITTEPLMIRGRMRLIWEDVWVVREDGPELLSSETAELRETG